MNRPLIVGIAGGSGSGKTYLAHQVARDAGHENVAVLSMDQYFQTEPASGVSVADVNFDHPAHLDFRLLVEHVKKLREGLPVHAPAYDFRAMKRTPRALLVEPRKVILVEGLFVLAEPLAALCDLRCFLDVAADERLLGRILRDRQERDATTEQVIDRYQRFVKAGYQIFVEPTKQNADVVVDFTYRRTLFSRLISHLISDSVREELDTEAFVLSLRNHDYVPGASIKGGYMPLAVDIFQLAKAYPESVLPIPS